ncbi:unnamed protein product [Blepharisma stoltei]|uniref:Alpha/beta hydrolase n=1 Tax=Blepharisma stoltei TaxID=1481888 RepID=A0AAU9JVS1_9CILI|nr:unnamed protein product [Blepharisma stoltei]
MEYFTNRHGLQLAYYMSIKYPEVKKIYLICPMWPSELFFLSEFIFEHLDANTFKIDITGSGNSQGEHSYAGFIRDSADIDDAVKFLTSRDYKVEGIIGQYKPAISSIIYSALYGDVKTIISISPRYNMMDLPVFLQDVNELLMENSKAIHRGLGREWICSREEMDEFRNLDMKYYCERVKGDIYIIHGDADTFCSPSDAQEYLKELKEKCKGIYTLNSDQFFIGVFDEIVEIIEKIISNN